MTASELLTDESRKIAFSPELAKIIGLNECLFLSQLQYWITQKERTDDNRTFRDGKMWVYGTYEHWQEQLPFMSARTLRRTIESLEKSGIIISGRYNNKGFDKTKWYTIDYEALDKMATSYVQNGQFHVAKMARRSGQNDQTNTIEYYKEYSEDNIQRKPLNVSMVHFTSENAQSCSQDDFSGSCIARQGNDNSYAEGMSMFQKHDRDTINYKSLETSIRKACERNYICDEYDRKEVTEIIVYFYHKFYDVFGVSHPVLNPNAMDIVVKSINDGTRAVAGCDSDTFKQMIDNYFRTDLDCDYHITHFVNENVMNNRFYDSEREEIAIAMMRYGYD